MSCLGLLYVQFMQLLYQYHRDKPRRKDTPHRKHKCDHQPYVMFAQQHSSPLPKRFLVFSGVQLHQHFVGWLAKTGKHFIGFMDSMHKIGCNTTLLLSLASVHSCHVMWYGRDGLLCRRTNSIVKSASETMYRHTKTIFVHRPVPPPAWTINVSAIDPDDYSDMPSVQDCTDSNAPFFFDTPYCFATTTDDEIHSLALHNTSKYVASDHVYSFTSEPTEFGTDNCATHHICSLLNLFVNMRPAPKVGVTGVAGSTMASGIGTIMFTITDDDGIKHKITLEDVIYLPESAKNLISTSKWSSDKHDNCGILSRGKFSIFMWDNDNNKKHIVHPPDCQIPLMPVNEADDAFVLFN